MTDDRLPRPLSWQSRRPTHIYIYLVRYIYDKLCHSTKKSNINEYFTFVTCIIPTRTTTTTRNQRNVQRVRDNKPKMLLFCWTWQFFIKKSLQMVTFSGSIAVINLASAYKPKDFPLLHTWITTTTAAHTYIEGVLKYYMILRCVIAKVLRNRPKKWITNTSVQIGHKIIWYPLKDNRLNGQKFGVKLRRRHF